MRPNVDGEQHFYTNSLHARARAQDPHEYPRRWMMHLCAKGSEATKMVCIRGTMSVL